MSEPATPSLFDRTKTFDQHVRAKEFDEAMATLIAILKQIEASRDGFGGDSTAYSPNMEREATILAAAIGTMISHEEFQLTRRRFVAFAQYKRAISQVFEISGFRGTSHLLEALGDRQEDGGLQLNAQSIPKLFAILSLNAVSPSLLQLFLRQDANLSWPIVLGFLSEQVLWSDKAEAVRSELLKSGHLWKDVKPTILAVRTLGPAYMGCSYAEADHKHEIKKVMNHVSRGYLESRGLKDIEMPEPRRAVKRRPTIAVIAELYDSKHAMHRCYGPSINSLRSKFKTVYVSPTGECDEAVAPMFDKVDTTGFKLEKPEIFINKVKSYKPDIVYFPSIGMRISTILSSTVRMAPIQMMTFGHPATTHSPVIDYAVLDQEQIGDPETVNETILCRKSVPRFEMRHDADDIKPMIRQKPPVVRIAVPAWSRKVTPNFLEMCRRISSNTSRQVEFWFFPNGVGPLYQAFRRRVEGMLPAKVFPRAGYNQYIQWLNQCDIFFSTVPFGATNGIVDSMRQGIPIINMNGREVHAATDQHLVKRFVQPDWLTTNSHQEFMAAAKRLIEDDQLRVKISQGILDCNPDERLLAVDNADELGFVEAFEAAYRHHETIQAAGKKMWTYDEVRALISQDS